MDLLNKRLDIMKELLDMLADEQVCPSLFAGHLTPACGSLCLQQNNHATKLEWIIIWLIVFEVVIMVIWDIIIKDILGFFPSN